MYYNFKIEKILIFIIKLNFIVVLIGLFSSQVTCKMKRVTTFEFTTVSVIVYYLVGDCNSFLAIFLVFKSTEHPEIKNATNTKYFAKVFFICFHLYFQYNCLLLCITSPQIVYSGQLIESSSLNNGHHWTSIKTSFSNQKLMPKS